MELDNECFGIGGQGTFPSGAFRFAGVAAEDPSFFTSGPPAIRLAKDAAAPLRRSLKSSVGQKLDSTEWLAVYSLTLEGHPLIVFQRPFQSWAPLIKNPATSTASFSEIFAIASQEAGKFALLHWKDNTGDDNQQILGVIHLQSGREFLVTTSSDPESQRYRIYGYRNGKFAMVFRYTAAEC